MRRLAALLPLVIAVALRAAEPPRLFLPPQEAPSVADAPCRVCRGTGKTAAEDRGVRTSTTGTTAFIVCCRTCDGIGRQIRPLSPAERAACQRTRRQRFDREQLAAGHVPVAGAYAERGATDALSPEDFARLAQRCPRPCKVCLGLGTEPCRKCKGRGKVIGRIRETNGEDAETEVTCPICDGTATQPCRRCEGGRLAPLCKKCGGTGVTTAKAGRDVPAHSKRCPSCKGEGRR